MLVAAAAAHGCLPPAQDVQCIEDANCSRFAGGACRTAPSGHRWCSYADSDCRSGYRYSDLDVGDGVSGQCAEVTYDLTVSVEGNGAGVVSSTSGELACSSGACTRSFLEGARVELAAEASSGAFLGWAQECRGPGACGMVMDRDRAATALFGTPGHPRWVKQVGGTGRDVGEGIAVDGDGNVIAVGDFSASLQIGGLTLTSAGGSDVFVVKLNGLTGGVIWALRFGGLDGEGGRAVRTDAVNNIYVMGNFFGVVDFGGGELRSAGGEDTFVLKLTATGDHVWSRRFGGVGGEYGEDLAVRGSAVAIVGSQDQSMAIGSLLLPHLGYFYSDVYVVMFTTDGDLVWSRSWGGANQDLGFGVALDSSGNVVIVGKCFGTVDFGGWPLTCASDDVFVAKYAGATGGHLFSRRYGGAGGDEARSVAVDSMDNIIVVGYFNDTVDFGGPVPLVGDGYANMFVAKYTLAGAHLWAKSFRATNATNTGSQLARSVMVDDAGDVVFTGEFCGTISFGGAEISSASECPVVFDTFAVRLAGADGSHANSVRAGSRAGLADMSLAAGGRLYLAGHFDVFAELGGTGVEPVSGADAFILALAPL